MDTYATCTEVLQLLGEEIPQTIDSKEMVKVINATSVLVKDVSDVKLLEMKEMDEKIRKRVQFYNLLIYVAHNARREMFPFFTCRVVQLTMEHGICDHGIHGKSLCDLLKSSLYCRTEITQPSYCFIFTCSIGLITYAVLLCTDKMAVDIPSGSRIGKAAMSSSMKKYHTTSLLPMMYNAYYAYGEF